MKHPPEPLDLLLPRPRRTETPDGAWGPGSTVHVHLADGVAPGEDPEELLTSGGDGEEAASPSPRPPAATALGRLRRSLGLHGVELRAARFPERADLVLALSDGDGGGGAESYHLAVGTEGALLEAPDAAGLLHASATLAQWIALAGEPRMGGLSLPTLRVDDAPAFPRRGVMLDVARDRVPRMEELLRWVELLAGWKVNELQLYTEHTFAYRGHEVVWRDASPLSPEEVRVVDAHCRSHGIELVPNQNSFGHFHRWLVHEPYRRLAECPEGVEHPWSHEPEPFSLCATDPQSLELLADLYDQLLPCFTSRRFNVGLDESFDLGRCRSKAACEERGTQRVYLEFLAAVHRLVVARGARMEFWGDVVLEEPSVIPELPAEVTALVWGYEADHPFAEQGERFAASGLDFVLCPGTSSWASLTGRTTNAVRNVARAAVAGRDAGASGLLLTDWGDYGHLQPWPVSLPGLAAGAAAAWNPDRPAGRDEVPALLDAHVFHDAAGRAGRAACDLGDTYLRAGGGNRNGTAYFHLLLHPERGMDEGRNEGLTADSLQDALDHLDACRDTLAGARMEAPDAELLDRELAWAADAATLACALARARREAGGAGAITALPRPLRSRFATDLAALLDRHRDLRLERARPGGLDHALAYLDPLRRLLEAG